MSSSEPRTEHVALRWLATSAVIVATAWLIGSRRAEAVPTNVEDALDALAYLVIGAWILLQAARRLTQTHKVRDGWVGNTIVTGFKPFRGSHPEFVAKYRRGLLGLGWTWVILGAVFIGLGVMLLAFPHTRQEPELVYPLSTWAGVFFGLSVLTLGVVFLRCRRILNSPAGS